MTRLPLQKAAPSRITALALTLGLLIPLAGQAQEKEGTTQSAGQKVGRFLTGVKDKLGLRVERPGQGSTGRASLYTPVTGEQTFKGLFRNEDHDQAIQGRLQWPRVALTFTEYGRSLPCWTVKATIWTNAQHSTIETFKTCLDAPLAQVNDLGETTVTNRYIGFENLMAAQPRFGGTPTTGSERTTGPNPPRLLFNVNVDSDMRQKVRNAVVNSAWVSGFYGQGNDLSHASIFYDYRMWIAGFDPAGNRN
ncbi:hypothetical protein [Stenotrophomonas acidaminiphila]|jgi:hypothetical protein